MNVKCRCRNCDGHIEFDSPAAGQTIPCPHCGLETMLFVPTCPTAAELMKKAGEAGRQKRVFIWLPMASLLVLGLALWLGSQIITSAGGALSGFMGFIVVIGFALAVLFCIYLAILWMIFPLFVYYSLGRIEKLLKDIATKR